MRPKSLRRDATLPSSSSEEDFGASGADDDDEEDDEEAGSDGGSWDGRTHPRRTVRGVARHRPIGSQHRGHKRPRRRRSSEEDEEESDEDMGGCTTRNTLDT